MQSYSFVVYLNFRILLHSIFPASLSIFQNESTTPALFEYSSFCIGILHLNAVFLIYHEWLARDIHVLVEVGNKEIRLGLASRGCRFKTQSLPPTLHTFKINGHKSTNAHFRCSCRILDVNRPIPLMFFIIRSLL